MLRSRWRHPPPPHVLSVKTDSFAVCDNLSDRRVCTYRQYDVCVCVCRCVQMKKKLGERK